MRDHQGMAAIAVRIMANVARGSVLLTTEAHLSATIRDAAGPDELRRALSAFVRRKDVATRSPPQVHARGPLEVKAVMAAHAVLTGDWSRVAAHERGWLWQAAKGGNVIGADSPPVPFPAVAAHDPVGVTADGHASVRFCFPWVPGGTAKGVASSLGHVTVTRLDSEDAPVACVLPVPKDLRDVRYAPVPLVVRRHGGGYLRPLLAPGGWRPCGLDAFAHHAAAGDAWVDNPFAQPHGGRMGVLGASDYARPVEVRGVDSLREDAAWRACLEAAGPLRVIDGVVHRTCGMPEAILAGTHERPTLTWRVDGLDGTTSMETIVGDAAGAMQSFSTRPRDAENPFAAVPVTEAALLVALRAQVMGIGGFSTLTAGTAVTSVDPALVPADPFALLRDLPIPDLDESYDAARAASRDAISRVVSAYDAGALDADHVEALSAIAGVEPHRVRHRGAPSSWSLVDAALRVSLPGIEALELLRDDEVADFRP